MPGRRSPRQSADRATAQHANRAFIGGLDGASALPAPVGEQTTGNQGEAPLQMFFHQDKYIASGGPQKCVLTFLPITNSEHVYLFPSGVATNGLYQREILSWSREAGTSDLQVLSGMNASSGDVIVVEYAYYTGLVSDLEWHDSPPSQRILTGDKGVLWIEGSDTYLTYGASGSNASNPLPPSSNSIYTDHLRPNTGGNGMITRLNVTSDSYGPWNPGYIRFGRARFSDAPAHLNATDHREFSAAYSTFHLDDRLVMWPYEPWSEYYDAGGTGGFALRIPGGSQIDVWPQDENYDWDAYDDWIYAARTASQITQAKLEFSGSFLVPYPVDDPTGAEPFPVYRLCHITSTQPVVDSSVTYPNRRVPTSANYCAGTVFATCNLYQSIDVMVDVTSFAQARLADFCVGGQTDWQQAGRDWDINNGGRVRMQATVMRMYVNYTSSVQWALLPEQ